MTEHLKKTLQEKRQELQKRRFVAAVLIVAAVFVVLGCGESFVQSLCPDIS